MDYVHPEEQWNAEAAFFNSDALHVLDAFNALEVEETSYISFADLSGNVAAFGSSCNNFSGYRKVELADFLLQGHFPHKVIE